MARSTSMEFLDAMLGGWLRLTAGHMDVSGTTWSAVHAVKRALRDDRTKLLNAFIMSVHEQEGREAENSRNTGREYTDAKE